MPLPKEKITIGVYARDYLLQHKEITDLVGTKIYPSVAPEKTPAPFIVYETDSYEAEKTKMGVYQYISEIVYEIVSNDYDTCLEIAVAMHDILQGKHGGFTFDIIYSDSFYKEEKYRQTFLFRIV
jgi:hypothetical protein